MSYDQERHMPQPDWARVLVNTDQKKMPVGDPAFWGNTVTTLIDASPSAPVPFSPYLLYSEQILLAHASDRYARSWSLSGTLTIDAQMWGESGRIPSGTFIDPSETTRLQVFLSVLQGIEKVTIEHQICLMSGGDPTNIGLCNNQCVTNGGPYVPLSPLPEGGEVGRSFAAVGALIGNTITVRAIFLRGGTPGSQGFLPQATISLLLAPYAPGAGI